MTAVGIIGIGAIGSAVARHLKAGAASGAELTAVVSRHPVDDAPFQWYAHWEEILPLVDVVVECASQAVAREVVVPALEQGKAVVPASVGAFANGSFYQEAVAASVRGQGRLIIPSGAVGGLDLLAALAVGDLCRVQLTTRKPPTSLGLEDILEPVEVFRGSAREAAERYPQNLNVAMTLALKGLGPGRTEVVLVADPNISANTHTVVFEADAGRYQLVFANVPDPSNPKTSLLASYSIVACIKSLSEQAGS